MGEGGEGYAGGGGGFGGGIFCGGTAGVEGTLGLVAVQGAGGAVRYGVGGRGDCRRAGQGEFESLEYCYVRLGAKQCTNACCVLLQHTAV